MGATQVRMGVCRTASGLRFAQSLAGEPQPEVARRWSRAAVLSSVISPAVSASTHARHWTQAQRGSVA